MDPAMELRKKLLDAITPMLHTESEVRVVEHNSPGEYFLLPSAYDINMKSKTSMNFLRSENKYLQI